MSNHAVMPLQDYINTCNKVRELTDITDVIKSGELPDKVAEVYEAGKEKEWSDFWEFYQYHGNRRSYKMAFAGHGWFSGNFYPKYSMKPTNAQSMFQESNFYAAFDLVARLEECGVTIDFSKVTGSGFNTLFFNAGVTTVPEVDTSSANTTSLNLAFSSANIVKIYGLKLQSTGNQTFPGTFSNASGLQEITITGGVIGQTINFAVSPLTVESMKSIITHLKNYAGTTSEFTYKTIFSSACLTALEAEGATSPNGNSWTQYIEDLGWLYS